MKKTLLVTIDYPPATGGIAQYWKQVTESLPADVFFVLNGGKPFASPNTHIVNSRLFFKRVWPSWLKGIFVIARMVKSRNIEQIIADQLLPVGSMVWLLSRVMPIEYFVQIHGMDLLQAQASPRKRWLARNILQGAKGIITNSNAVSKLIREFAGELKISVVYPIPPQPKPADQERLRRLRQQYSLEGKKILLTVGRLVPRKGVDRMLQALGLILHRFDDALYVIVGDGPYKEELQSLAKAYGRAVLFTGSVDDEERDTWFELADIFVMPARQLPDDIEGFGIVYLQAGWRGKPVVAGKSGGVTEAVINGETGLCIDGNNPEQIAQAVVELLKDPGFARQLGAQAKTRLQGEFSWQRSVEQLKNILS